MHETHVDERGFAWPSKDAYLLNRLYEAAYHIIPCPDRNEGGTRQHVKDYVLAVQEAGEHLSSVKQAVPKPGGDWPGEEHGFAPPPDYQPNKPDTMKLAADVVTSIRHMLNAEHEEILADLRDLRAQLTGVDQAIVAMFRKVRGD